MHRPLASVLAFSGTVAAATLAAGLSLLPGTARADDITIDPTPFVGTRSRAEVRDEVLRDAGQLRASAGEWAQQQGEPRQMAGGRTRGEVRDEYIGLRDAVRAMTAEDSGSSVLARASRPATDTMLAATPMR